MNFQKTNTKEMQKGFTLIELLVVIGILAVLLAITLIAINPARQFAQANDTKRRSAATQILNAIGAYHADNRGNLPAAISDPSGSVPIGEIRAAAATNPRWPLLPAYDLCATLVTEYMPALPQDPSMNGGDDILEADCADYATGYKVVNNSGRITISTDSEVDTASADDDLITVTR